MFHAGGAGRGVRAGGGAGAAPDHGGDAGRYGGIHLLRRYEMDMRIYPPSREDPPFTSQDLGGSLDSTVTPSIVSGFPALPMPAMRPSRTPTSAL